MMRKQSFSKTMVDSIVALSPLTVSALLPVTKARIIVVGGVVGTRISAYFKMSLPDAGVMVLTCVKESKRFTLLRYAE